LNATIVGFLIDECLSGELADLARERGHHALAANRMSSLRRRSDYGVATYAIDRDLILVTNDMFDLEAIYEEFEIHPGIVFITAGRSKLRTLPYQLKMFDLALDEVEQEYPLSEAIWISAKDGKKRSVNINIRRIPLPKPAEVGGS
jgi:predicted nuclease of predicted toxin-antitoxin system